MLVARLGERNFEIHVHGKKFDVVLFFLGLRIKKMFAKQRRFNYLWLQMKKFGNQATMLRKHSFKCHNERRMRRLKELCQTY